MAQFLDDAQLKADYEALKDGKNTFTRANKKYINGEVRSRHRTWTAQALSGRAVAVAEPWLCYTLLALCGWPWRLRRRREMYRSWGCFADSYTLLALCVRSFGLDILFDHSVWFNPTQPCYGRGRGRGRGRCRGRGRRRAVTFAVVVAVAEPWPSRDCRRAVAVAVAVAVAEPWPSRGRRRAVAVAVAAAVAVALAVAKPWPWP